MLHRPIIFPFRGPLVAIVAAIALSFATASAQQTYRDEVHGYSLELPSDGWKAVVAQQRTDFVYNGDRTEGYLRLRTATVDPDTPLIDLARREADTKLSYLYAFVERKEEQFTGRLTGLVGSYEFTSGGKAMAGLTYYLRADGGSVYVLDFTGARDRLYLIRNQTDAIARSVRPD